MSKLLSLLVLFIVLTRPGYTSAALLDSVVIDGKAWLQPVEFIDYGWSDIAQVCDPQATACVGFLGERDLTGYTWASQLDVSSLYAAAIPSFWTGGIDSVFLFGNPVVAEFNDFFDVLGFVPTLEAVVLGPLRQLFAYTADSSAIETVFQATDYFAENIYVASNNGDYQSVNPGHAVGAWFFQPVVVPVPGTASLLCLALFVLSARRRAAALPGPHKNDRVYARSSTTL